MMRKQICIVVALIMACLSKGAFALEKLATPTNLRWDGYIARWDEIPGETTYSLCIRFSLDGSDLISQFYTGTADSYYDCTDAFGRAGDSFGISQGIIRATFTVRAETSDCETNCSSDESAPSPEKSYEMAITKEKLDTPVNLRWEGNIAFWDEVPNASYYSFHVSSIRDASGESVGVVTNTEVAYYDCTDALKDIGNSMGMTEGTIQVTFTVQAQTRDYDFYLSGEKSAASPLHAFDLPVRERLEMPGNLRWEGTKAMWDEVSNASGYSFELRGGSYGLSTSVNTNSFDCLDKMKQLSNGVGKLDEFLVFTFTVKAYSNNRDLYIDSYTSETSPKIYINPIAKDELPGDIDIDGVPGVSDARIVLQAIAKGNVSEAVRQVADVDNNGKLDANDALKIMQYSAGWNVTLK